MAKHYHRMCAACHAEGIAVGHERLLFGASADEHGVYMAIGFGTAPRPLQCHDQSLASLHRR